MYQFGVLGGNTYAVGVKELSLREVWFENPGSYTQLQSLQSIATEWSRIFPQIRRSPCPADVYGPEIHLEEHTSSRESGGDDGDWSTDDDSEGSLDDPGLDLDFDEYDSEHTSSRELVGHDGDWSINGEIEMSLNDPAWDLDFEDYDSDWFRLRRRLWKFLGYDMEAGEDVIASTNRMWQNSFEVETFDWPIIPMSAFLDPGNHPSAEIAEMLDLTTFSA